MTGALHNLCQMNAPVFFLLTCLPEKKRNTLLPAPVFVAVESAPHLLRIMRGQTHKTFRSPCERNLAIPVAAAIDLRHRGHQGNEAI